MWCYNFINNNGLFLMTCIFVAIDSLASSTTEDCELCRGLQNVKPCSKTDCTVVCNDGYWGERCEFGRTR